MAAGAEAPSPARSGVAECVLGVVLAIEILDTRQRRCLQAIVALACEAR